MNDTRRPVLVRPEIEGITPYVPGKPVDELKRELGLDRAIKLASNENPLGPSPLAIEAMRSAAGEVNIYPDGGAFYLRDALAERLSVDPADLLVANGSNEAIEILIRTFGRIGDRTLTSRHSFIVYKLASRAAGLPVDEVDMTADLQFDLAALADCLRADTRFVFIANPNNPTGTFVDDASLRAFLDRVDPDTFVMLDEAYFEYADGREGYPNGLRLRDDYPDNLVILRTFSKAYGLAGVRLGYAVLPERCRGFCDRVRAPFNTSLLAQRAGVAALQDGDYLERSIAANADGLQRLVNDLEALGIETVESAANFVLAKFSVTGSEVFDALLQEGLIVRPMAGYELPNHVRISVGRPDEMDLLIETLRSKPELR